MWLWTGLLGLLGLLIWASAFFLGDRTEPEEQPAVGAGAGFGSLRAAVLPAQATPFDQLAPLQTRDLGRLVHLRGTAQSPVVANAVWVRADDGRRILVRFEPAPPEEVLQGIGPGSRIELRGYLQRIARAELNVWTDTLGVTIPRPPPGRKFGDLPPPEFARIDSLFVKSYFISARPNAFEAADIEEDAA